MKASPKRGLLSGASVNDMSSEEDSGSSSTDNESDVDITNHVSTDMNLASLNSPSSSRNSDLASNMRQFDSPPTASPASNIRTDEGVPSSNSPQPGSSESGNRSERDLSQEEVDKLVQLQDLTGICIRAFKR